MNPALTELHPYPFEKLAVLMKDIKPPAHLSPILLSIGEPRHAAPEFVKQALVTHLNHLSTYPGSKGIIELRTAIAKWLVQRFGLNSIDADTQVLPVSGTREGLFSFTQAVFKRANLSQAGDTKAQPEIYVVMPNPFYQIYEGAAILAGATPYYVNASAETSYLADYASVPVEIWQRTQLLFICSPGNPTGAVIPAEQLRMLIALADEYDFIIASDECYSELYFDTPPVGLLEVCAQLGRHDYKRCVVFHSLSKRSNVPGLRSGFVAGDADILAPFLKYRTYHGAAMPVQNQWASVAAWQDETHVEANRVQYRQKFALFLNELGDKFNLSRPDAGFYLWVPVADDEAFTRTLLQQLNIQVLPGRYLSRATAQGNAGLNYVRMALVADVAQCEQAVQRLKSL